MATKQPTVPEAESSTSQREYVEMLKQSAWLVEQVQRECSGVAPADIYHILLSLKESPEKRLQRGLRRRIFDEPGA